MRRLDALEQQHQGGEVELPIPGLLPVADEAPALQALGPQAEAAAIPVQRLEVVTAAVGRSEGQFVVGIEQIELGIGTVPTLKMSFRRPMVLRG